MHEATAMMDVGRVVDTPVAKLHIVAHHDDEAPFAVCSADLDPTTLTAANILAPAVLPSCCRRCLNQWWKKLLG